MTPALARAIEDATVDLARAILRERLARDALEAAARAPRIGKNDLAIAKLELLQGMCEAHHGWAIKNVAKRIKDFTDEYGEHMDVEAIMETLRR